MSAKCEAVLDMMAKALDDDEISESAFRAFNKSFDPARGNIVEAVQSMRKATTTDNFNRARDIERANAIKLAVDEGEGTSGIVNLFANAFKAMSNTANIPTRASSIEGQLRRKTGETDEVLATKVWDWFQRDPEANEDYIRSMLDMNYQSDKFPEFRDMADKYGEAFEEARILYNKEGGSIGDARLKDSGQGYLPQYHDGGAMLDMGPDAWKLLVRNKLDYQRMGYKSNTSQDFEDMLDNVFDTITSKGQNKLLDSEGEIKFRDNSRGRGKRLTNQRMEERFLHFKDATDWIDYAKDMNFRVTGKQELPNVYTTMRTHLRGMSNDIATMQIMGSDPDKMFNYALEYAHKKGKFDTETEGMGKLNSARKKIFMSDYDGRLKAMFNVALGRADMDLSNGTGSRGFGMVSGTYRSVMVASQLGGASISSIVDVATSAMATTMVGNSVIKTEVSSLVALMERAMGAFDKKNKVSEAEMFSIRLGFASDSFMTAINNKNKWAESGGGSPRMQRIAEGVLRVSGLTAWTNARRSVWKLELAGLMGDNIGKPLDSFTFGKRMMKQYGITEEQWKTLGEAHKTPFKNGGYIDTTKIYETDTDLALRLQDMMETETNYAVVMPDARTRAFTTGGYAKGTVKGEAFRTLTMFKSFPITLMATQLSRMAQIESMGGKVAYGSAMFIGLSTMGTAVVQMKAMLKGEEPKELSGKLMIEGMGMGGGLGLFADLLLKEETRFGQSTAEALFMGIASKPWSDVKDIYDATTGLKENASLSSELMNTALSYVPGKNLFYTRAIYERMVANQLKEMADPKYRSKMRRKKQRMKDDFNQGYLWEPSN